MSAAEFIEYSITIKDEKNTLTEKDISYEPMELSIDNEMLANQVSQLMERFTALSPDQDDLEAPAIVIRLKMVWQA